MDFDQAISDLTPVDVAPAPVDSFPQSPSGDGDSGVAPSQSGASWLLNQVLPSANSNADPGAADSSDPGTQTVNDQDGNINAEQQGTNLFTKQIEDLKLPEGVGLANTLLGFAGNFDGDGGPSSPFDTAMNGASNVLSGISAVRQAKNLLAPDAAKDPAPMDPAPDPKRGDGSGPDHGDEAGDGEKSFADGPGVDGAPANDLSGPRAQAKPQEWTGDGSNPGGDDAGSGDKGGPDGPGEDGAPSNDIGPARPTMKARTNPQDGDGSGPSGDGAGGAEPDLPEGPGVDGAPSAPGRQALSDLPKMPEAGDVSVLGELGDLADAAGGYVAAFQGGWQYGESWDQQQKQDGTAGKDAFGQNRSWSDKEGDDGRAVHDAVDKELGGGFMGEAAGTLLGLSTTLEESTIGTVKAVADLPDMVGNDIVSESEDILHGDAAEETKMQKDDPTLSKLLGYIPGGQAAMADEMRVGEGLDKRLDNVASTVSNTLDLPGVEQADAQNRQDHPILQSIEDGFGVGYVKDEIDAHKDAIDQTVQDPNLGNKILGYADGTSELKSVARWMDIDVSDWKI